MNEVKSTQVLASNDDEGFSSFINFFRHWKKLGFFSVLHWKLVLYWVALLVIVGYMPLYLIKHPRELDNYFIISSNYYPVMVVVTLSFLVIAVGTLLYAIDVFKQTFNADKKIKSIALLYGISAFACIACVVTCGIGIYTLKISPDIHNLVIETEDFTRYIFFTLLGIDVLMLITKLIEIRYYKKITVNEEDLKRSKNESRFILNQMLLIDIPVLLGVLFISNYVHGADDSGFYDTQISKYEKIGNFQFFKTFFAVGSIGMHIIFSQFIFLILSTKMFYSEIKEKVFNKK